MKEVEDRYFEIAMDIMLNDPRARSIVTAMMDARAEGAAFASHKSSAELLTRVHRVSKDLRNAIREAERDDCMSPATAAELRRLLGSLP